MSPEARKLLHKLTHAHPHREVYIAHDRRSWHITYQMGQVSATAVMELVNAGLIHSVYSNCPGDMYHVGGTIDIEATREAIRRHGKGAPMIYVDDAP